MKTLLSILFALAFTAYSQEPKNFSFLYRKNITAAKEWLGEPSTVMAPTESRPWVTVFHEAGGYGFAFDYVNGVFDRARIDYFPKDKPAPDADAIARMIHPEGKASSVSRIALAVDHFYVTVSDKDIWEVRATVTDGKWCLAIILPPGGRPWEHK